MTPSVTRNGFSELVCKFVAFALIEPTEHIRENHVVDAGKYYIKYGAEFYNGGNSFSLTPFDVIRAIHLL